ncbi:hypothetical protein [Bacteroides sp. f07]
MFHRVYKLNNPRFTQTRNWFYLIKNMTDTMLPEIEKMICQTKQKRKL